MEDRIASCHSQLAAYFGDRNPGRGVRYLSILRAEAAEIATASLAHGGYLGSVATQLGVGDGTLRRWIDTAVPQRVGQLRTVEVVDTGKAAHAQGHDHGGKLVLVTAGGHRVEGFSLAEAALLLESLG